MESDSYGTYCIALDCLLSKSIRPWDSEDEVHQKRLLVPPLVFFLVLMTAISLKFLHLSLSDDGVVLSYGLGAVGGAAVLWATVLLLLFGNLSVRSVTTVMCVGITFALLAMDWNLASSGTARAWELAVLIMDVMLVMGIENAWQFTVLAVVLIWLAVEKIEAGTRFGLYEAGKWPGDTSDTLPFCDCADPPCSLASSSVVLMYAGVAFIFLSDYRFTRGFASGMRHQMKLVRTSASVAERVSTLLAAYAVADAREVLRAECDHLPPDMLSALNKLLHNLEEYRAYLPEALLVQADSDDAVSCNDSASPHVQPPGLGAEHADVCICFTDIQSSSALWEAHPQAMYDALRAHNSVLRQAAAEERGYEVKTIGDAFMLAFETPVNACRFSMSAQRGLLQEDYPLELLRDELCSPERVGGVLVWRGLRVRIGIHCGAVCVERNPVTRRCDYFGSVVNTASRVETSLKYGGLTGITDSVSQAIESSLRELGDPAIRCLGPREMKGIAEPVTLYTLLPPELDARNAVVVQEPSRAAPCDAGGLSDLSFSGRNCSTASAKSAASAQLTHNKALHLGLHRSAITSCVVRLQLGTLDCVESDVSELASIVEMSADRSRGELHSVFSCTAMVTWNAAKTCDDPAAHCASFLASVRCSASLILSCGAASGESSCGNIAAGRRRFATVVAPCIELAAALAEEAQQCEDFALCAGTVAAHFRATGQAYRAQQWRSGSTPGVYTTIWEVDPKDTSALESSGRKWATVLLPHDGCTERSLDAVMDAVFRLATAVDASGIEELLEDVPDCDEKQKLMARTKRGAVKERICALSADCV